MHHGRETEKGSAMNTVSRWFGAFIFLGGVGAFGTACASSGVGTGVLTSATPATNSPTAQAGAAAHAKNTDLPSTVRFYWHSDGSAQHGVITALLGDGRRFRGTWVEPTHVTEALTPDGGWGWEFPYASGYAEDFITTYSGVLESALADDSKSTVMQCRFVLASPVSGPEGGGLGRCTLSDGRVIEKAELHGGQH